MKNIWTRDELILTLSVYFQLPFGRLNHSTPEVKELARLIGRTNNSAALRLVNFAACDPYIINSGRKGMPAGIPVCKPIWEEFANDKERLFCEAQRIKANFLNKTIEETLNITEKELEGKEKEVVIKQRVNQSIFRTMVLANYENRCAITGINIPDLLVAGHIIPWAESTPQQKLNPENGICLSSLYDKAFDKGFITILPDDYTIVLSSALREYETQDYFDKHFGSVSGQRILMPIEHSPNRDYLAYHRDHIFMGM
ncbi:MAG: HNH endonuclease [Bacteroidales bacterium]|nr:HNH endonuclease [Bacteroidales bacterium]